MRSLGSDVMSFICNSIFFTESSENEERRRGRGGGGRRGNERRIVSNPTHTGEFIEDQALYAQLREISRNTVYVEPTFRSSFQAGSSQHSSASSSRPQPALQASPNLQGTHRQLNIHVFR